MQIGEIGEIDQIVQLPKDSLDVACVFNIDSVTLKACAHYLFRKIRTVYFEEGFKADKFIFDIFEFARHLLQLAIKKMILVFGRRLLD